MSNTASNTLSNTVSFTTKAPLTNIDDVLKPIEEARGLPNAHYISAEVYEEEKQELIFNKWAGLDVGSSIPNTGDAKPLDFFGMPLLIIRDRDGSIGVFQNSCRHRGMILVSEPTKVRGVISCPYHGWCYGTKGDLRATPHVGGVGENTHESIKNEELGLFKHDTTIVEAEDPQRNKDESFTFEFTEEPDSARVVNKKRVKGRWRKNKSKKDSTENKPAVEFVIDE